MPSDLGPHGYVRLRFCAARNSAPIRASAGSTTRRRFPPARSRPYRHGMYRYRLAPALLVPVFLAACAPPVTLTAEPPAGQLRPGETVLVDDGTCPAGQVKQLSGGSDTNVGSGLAQAGAPRQRRCVPRP